MRMTSDIATCMYHTGLDPFSGEEVYIAKHLRDRKLQRALLQFFKPENDFEVRQALMAAGRSALIRAGCDCLIPAQPPRAALQARMAQARRELTAGRFVPTIEAGEAPRPSHREGEAPAPPNARTARSGRAPGYRPHRKSTRNQRRPR
jgi:hypothetical protein